MSQVLQISEQEVLPKGTIFYMSDDGTVYYNKYISPERLYVKSQRKDIDAELPSSIVVLAPHGNEMYFSTKDKIYKAAFSIADGIAVSYLRDKLEGETFNSYGYCIRRIDGNKYIYRLSDNSYRDGITVDDCSGNRKDMLLVELHRGIAYYISIDQYHSHPAVRKLTPNEIVVKIPHVKSVQFYANECSRFIYITLFDKDIHVLDTTTMEFLPVLQFEGFECIWKIVGVHNKEIAALAIKDSCHFIITANLPNEYIECDNAINANAQTESVHNIVNRLEEMSTSITNFDFFDDECCCSICSEHFDSVKIIPLNLICGHTFCQVCINNDKMRIDNKIKCPNCATITSLQEDETLPKNFALIRMSEQLMKSRVDPKVTCKACNEKFSSTFIRMCIKEDCSMFNQLICANCVLDGDHGGHVVKYDVKMEKIRKEIREEVAEICAKIEDKKKTVIELTAEVTNMAKTLETNVAAAKIPAHVIDQLETLASGQEAKEYLEIVKDLSQTLVVRCETVAYALRNALANGFDFLDENAVEST